ncbi:hypothetical protein EHP00_2013 [Ecytonucleospora hepatopenaei]|uniref:Uncharacterized protein n=1 Tax=Ecytonucleospora hepatopenaei TaxID=646526 RepID=A0A1W0E8V2_9MICR|nr:hypothetical protein EHP00_2013 [Ecytonucleospora hepatopenaei]
MNEYIYYNVLNNINIFKISYILYNTKICIILIDKEVYVYIEDTIEKIRIEKEILLCNINNNTNINYNTDISNTDINYNNTKINNTNDISNNFIFNLLCNILNLQYDKISLINYNLKRLKNEFNLKLRSRTLENNHSYTKYLSKIDNYLDDIINVEQEIIAIENYITYIRNNTNKLYNSNLYNSNIHNLNNTNNLNNSNNLYNSNINNLNNTILSIKYNKLIRLIKSSKTCMFKFKSTYTESMDLKFAIKQDKVNDTIQKISLVTFLFLPIQAISGIFGMNIAVPFEHEKSLKYFYGLILITPICYIGYYIGYKVYRILQNKIY